MTQPHPVTRATGVLGAAPYETRITFGRHLILADEPQSAGGRDAGASPFALVLSGLIACTAITLRMYAERKGWTLAGVTVEAAFHHDAEHAHIERTIAIDGDIDAAGKARMMEIAERTPVTLALKAGLEIRSELRETA